MFEVRPALPSELGVLVAIDDDASQLYAEHGIQLTLTPDHEFCRAERARWQRSLTLGRALLAVDRDGHGAGFATLDWLDEAAYLDQLAVRLGAMRQGIGRSLLEHARAWGRAEGARALWLTTYGHLRFNRPYYERHGFEVVPDADCGPSLRHHLDEQRRFLPEPTERVAMRHVL